MGLRYNPFTGSFDLTRSPGSYIDGEVAAYSDLPLDAAAAPLNSAWLVRAGSGLWLLTRKPAGIYIRTATTGVRDADYTYAGTFPDVFSDANFVVYNDADSTKNVKLDASAITTGTTRTLTVPDKSGTIATTDASDLTSGTLADARLSANVALKDAANTFTANQTLNGTNNVAPNQTAASGSSVMTRDLVRTYHREVLSPFFWDSPPSLFGTGTANSGVANTQGNTSRIHTSASVLGSAAWMDIAGRDGSGINHTNAGSGGSNINWDHPFALSFVMGRISAMATTSLDFRITRTTTTPAYTVPAGEFAVGWKMDNMASNVADMQAFSADGTNVAYASKLTGLSFNDLVPFRVSHDGTNVKLEYYNTASGWILIGSVARPQSSAASSNYRVRLAVINNGVTAQRIDVAVFGSCRVFLTQYT